MTEIGNYFDFYFSNNATQEQLLEKFETLSAEAISGLGAWFPLTGNAGSGKSHFMSEIMTTFPGTFCSASTNDAINGLKSFTATSVMAGTNMQKFTGTVYTHYGMRLSSNLNLCKTTFKCATMEQNVEKLLSLKTPMSKEIAAQHIKTCLGPMMVAVRPLVAKCATDTATVSRMMATKLLIIDEAGRLPAGFFAFIIAITWRITKAPPLIIPCGSVTQSKPIGYTRSLLHIVGSNPFMITGVTKAAHCEFNRRMETNSGPIDEKTHKEAWKGMLRICEKNIPPVESMSTPLKLNEISPRDTLNPYYAPGELRVLQTHENCMRYETALRQTKMRTVTTEDYGFVSSLIVLTNHADLSPSFPDSGKFVSEFAAKSARGKLWRKAAAKSQLSARNAFSFPPERSLVDWGFKKNTLDRGSFTDAECRKKWLIADAKKAKQRYKTASKFISNDDARDEMDRAEAAHRALINAGFTEDAAEIDRGAFDKKKKSSANTLNPAGSMFYICDLAENIVSSDELANHRMYAEDLKYALEEEHGTVFNQAVFSNPKCRDHRTVVSRVPEMDTAYEFALPPNSELETSAFDDEIDQTSSGLLVYLAYKFTRPYSEGYASLGSVFAYGSIRGFKGTLWGALLSPRLEGAENNLSHMCVLGRFLEIFVEKRTEKHYQHPKSIRDNWPIEEIFDDDKLINAIRDYKYLLAALDDRKYRLSSCNDTATSTTASNEQQLQSEYGVNPYEIIPNDESRAITHCVSVVKMCTSAITKSESALNFVKKESYSAYAESCQLYQYFVWGVNSFREPLKSTEWTGSVKWFTFPETSAMTHPSCADYRRRLIERKDRRSTIITRPFNHLDFYGIIPKSLEQLHPEAYLNATAIYAVEDNRTDTESPAGKVIIAVKPSNGENARYAATCPKVPWESVFLPNSESSNNHWRAGSSNKKKRKIQKNDVYGLMCRAHSAPADSANTNLAHGLFLSPGELQFTRPLIPGSLCGDGGFNDEVIKTVTGCYYKSSDSERHPSWGNKLRALEYKRIEMIAIQCIASPVFNNNTATIACVQGRTIDGGMVTNMSEIEWDSFLVVFSRATRAKNVKVANVDLTPTESESESKDRNLKRIRQLEAIEQSYLRL